MAPKKVAKRPAAKAYKLPDKIAQGQILVDVTRKQWRLGKSVGQGGFGEIYLASDKIDKPVGDQANFVIKVEPHSNGPLFTEMHCYIRIAKPEFIENWKKEKKLKRLGMPKYLGSGSHEYQGQKYRFMVMERFGDDLQKIIERHDKKFSYKTVVQVAIQILDVLEYIHSYEYIHADIKASNLLVGYQPGTQNQVFLVDYGLACRYKIDGKHKEYKYDQRKAHDGTIEFTSRDAHIGAHSRRGDLEILGYNLVQWLCGKLPWEDNLQDCNYVAGKKRALMEDVPKLMNICFANEIPPGVQEYMEYIASLTFDEKPNYEKCRNILRDGLKKRGYKEDGKLVFMSATPKQSKPSSRLTGRKKAVKRRSEEAENMGETSPKRRLPLAGRSPCKPRNFSSRLNKRLCPKDSMLEVGPGKPQWPEYVVDADDMVIEKENQKMLERKRQQRPKRMAAVKKDTSLDNPTPQMLEIMTRMREKSISPICTKKHRHNSNCQQGFRVSPTLDQPPNEFTPAMEEVMKKRSDRRQSSDSESSCSNSLSSELFDSEEDFELEEETENNATVYYSPCGSTSPTVDCANDKHKLSAAKVPVRNYSSRRVSLSNRRKGHNHCKPKVEVSPPIQMRITRSWSRNSCSPEIF